MIYFKESNKTRCYDANFHQYLDSVPAGEWEVRKGTFSSSIAYLLIRGDRVLMIEKRYASWVTLKHLHIAWLWR